MNQIWLIIIAIAVAVTAGFIVSLIIELKKTLRSLNDFLKTTEETIKPTVEELQQVLASVRSVSNDVNDITSDIKTLSGTVRDVGQNIRYASSFIGGLASGTTLKAAGIKAGVKTALGVLLKNFLSKKGDAQ
jgi:uncharacterized protein YoxC